MSVSILVVDDEPDVAELFRQPFVVRPARARMCCITRLSRAAALDRLAVKSNWLLSSLTSTCPTLR